MPVKGFFSGSELAQVKPPPSMVPKCGACGFYKQCESPKMETFGEGKKRILVVSSYPGEKEDKQNRPLTGNSGQEVKRALMKAGVMIERDCWLDNALICHPSGKVTNEHIDYCRPNIIKRVKELKPEVIILIGSEAVQSVIGWLWKDNPGTITQWAGWRIPCQSLNTWICPTYNPAYVIRERDNKNPIPRLLYELHLSRAVQLAGSRPWESVPDWSKEVEVVMDTDKAARILHKMIAKGGTVAFDYEANMLKPEGKDARIVSCSVCWNGKKTIAYPWHGEAIPATIELLRSPLPKIAANLKFEDRWTRRLLKTPVRNWYFDTMIGAHAIDSRSGTKSLKFQAFVHLGMDSYNDHIERFFQSGGTMKPNRIHEVSLPDLLLYNGLDTLLEFKLAKVQMELMNYPLPQGMQ